MTDLHSYYLSTLYKVEDFKHPIVIGQTHLELEGLLSKRNVTHWSYLTAWNPKSQSLPNDENRTLFNEIHAKPSYLVLNGLGESPDGHWSEESFLVLGMTEKEAAFLAKKFEQNAFVCGEKGKPARLVFVEFS